MKKHFLTLATVIASAALYCSPATAASTLTPSASSAAADGGSAITFTFHADWRQCTSTYNGATISWEEGAQSVDCSSYTDGVNPAQDIGPAIAYDPGAMPYNVHVSGSGNTLSGVQASGSFNIVYLSGGSASFTLKSNVAESKTVQLATTGKGSHISASTTVTFTSAGAGASASTAQSSTSGTTATPKSTTTAPSSSTATQSDSAAPAAPTPESIKLNNGNVTADHSVTLAAGVPIVLSGKTIPNGIVTLTIHSTPKTATVTADANGDWTYTVDRNSLEPGNHTVYATVTDPTTKQTSAQSTLLSFKLTADKRSAATVAQVAAAKKSSKGRVIAVGALLVILAAGVGYLIWRRKHAVKPATFSSN